MSIPSTWPPVAWKANNLAGRPIWPLSGGSSLSQPAASSSSTKLSTVGLESVAPLARSVSPSGPCDRTVRSVVARLIRRSREVSPPRIVTLAPLTDAAP